MNQELKKPMCVICLREFELNQVCEEDDFLIRCDDCLELIQLENYKDLPPRELLKP